MLHFFSTSVEIFRQTSTCCRIFVDDMLCHFFLSCRKISTCYTFFRHLSKFFDRHRHVAEFLSTTCCVTFSCHVGIFRHVTHFFVPVHIFRKSAKLDPGSRSWPVSSGNAFRRVRNPFRTTFREFPEIWSGMSSGGCSGPVSGNSRKVVRNGFRRVRNGFREPFPGIPGKWSGTPSGSRFRPDIYVPGQVFTFRAPEPLPEPFRNPVRNPVRNRVPEGPERLPEQIPKIPEGFRTPSGTNFQNKH